MRFVQFQKNACFHRVLSSSPFAVLFGDEPKLGLSSTSLHPSIFNNIRSEEELADKLGVATTDRLRVDSCSSDDEPIEPNIAELKLDAESDSSDESNDNNQLNIIVEDEQNDEALTSRVQRTNVIRETARKGQKRQANEFLQNTAKRHKLANFNVGDNAVSDVCSNFIYSVITFVF